MRLVEKYKTVLWLRNKETGKLELFEVLLTYFLGFRVSRRKLARLR